MPPFQGCYEDTDSWYSCDGLHPSLGYSALSGLGKEIDCIIFRWATPIGNIYRPVGAGYLYLVSPEGAAYIETPGEAQCLNDVLNQLSPEGAVISLNTG